MSPDYDGNGNRVRQRDVTGKVTEYRFNLLDRLTEVWDDGEKPAEYGCLPDATIRREIHGPLTKEYTYDKNGNCIRSISPKGYEREHSNHNVDSGEPKKRGIGGAHKKDVFMQNDMKVIRETPNPNINGVTTIEYQIPKLDKTGTSIPGEYQGGVPKVKTVYDPDTISTEEYLNKGLEAADNAASQSPDGLLSQEWVGVDNNERGYVARIL